MTSLASASRLLLCLRYGIGDVVMELPAVRALRRAAPAADLRALGASPATQVLEGDPDLDGLTRASTLGLRDWRDPGDERSRRVLGAWLDRLRPDLVLDPTHAILAVREAVRERGLPTLDVGEEVQERALRETGQGDRAVRRSVRWCWGVDLAEDDEPALVLRPDERGFAARHPAVRRAGGPLFAISPAASSPLKAWPAERFAAAADALLDRFGGAVLVLAGPRSRDAAAIRKAMRRADRAIVAGALHLRRTAALLERCALFVGNDTGLSHMAAAVGTPVAAVFGPTSPDVYLPPGPACAAAVGPDCPVRSFRFGPADCVAAGRCLLRERPCVADVSVERVLDAVARLESAGALPGRSARPTPRAWRILRPRPASVRTLDLRDLERPEFRSAGARLDALRAERPHLYLHPSKRWEYPWAVESADLRPGAAVLDAGCGGSVFPAFLSAQGYRVAAMDRQLPPSSGSPGVPRLEYVRGDVTRIPFAAETFAAVFCVSVVEHLERDGVPAALQEIRRVLRPGGRLLLTTDFYDDPAEEIWYEGPGPRFRVDWNIFDESRLRAQVLSAPGFRPVDGADLSVDWPAVKPLMRTFHGYPYTTVGVALVKE